MPGRPYGGPVPAIRLNHTDLYYEDMGDGSPLVMLSGLGVHLGVWAGVAPTLARTHRVVLPDHRGSGRSAPVNDPLTISHLADDVHALTSTLRLPRVNLLGHSMGGFIAMEIAARYPELVERVILYSTSMETISPALRFLESIEQVWKECPDISNATLSRIFLPWNWSPALLDDAATVEGIVEMAGHNPYPMSYASYRAQLAACRAFDGRALATRIVSPTLVIAGRNDLISPLRCSEELAQTIPGARLRISPCGHMTHMEKPGWFCEAVLDFTASENSPSC